MNITHVPEIHRTDKQHTENLRHWRKILGIAPFVSIVFPAIMYFISDEDSFKKSLLLRFITILLPFSYSAVQYAILLHTTPYYTLNLLFLAFAAISILSITALPINEWKGDDSLIFSIVLPSLFIPPTYLLSTSCRLVPGQTAFTDTGINVLIDILILLCPLVSLVLVCKEPEYRLLSAVPFPILILARLLNDRYCPSEKSAPPTAPWRVAILVLILTSAALIYAFMMWTPIAILNGYFGLLHKLRESFLSLRPD
ncbi:hypothetical protein [Encephalitozoon cuniculi GB-M1]|uniref:UPF0328 protein ECU01_0070/ECU01_1540/ECU02_1570/ECU04_0080/ECU08_2100 n=1 Tax=Encephalitozoon cuniculi (strain GB-M1) TaxID=284813 RepID=Y107_ENCCU|nr:uncharacterized protein ECU01_0070 [Encephalitozoon cuniculi GB-M1]NP_001402240.1 uncharacterized protein ECU01_1540 [Encephalitozoon cuniculi GB-M1]NP_584682.1 uncharacterized protein ECU02_1570 [Encephalitozoon cuniculi GB-M1]NP_584691.1 uncharacterized protein ECU04_0080 [Encephalitozoon cuniculi GB-M1]NP_597336.1 uncharacterized protein ECU08_2100 [Encephalitozoon cuniculi GB-M1]Q8ST97.1 RecName: Full=UPF0328 protein ECU01_0070/ECU01_1540/ECU02_1570/ECU04_0080/ECU08_2100 [Encephalitozoo